MIDPTGTIITTIRTALDPLSDGWQDAPVRGGMLQENDRPRAILVQRVSTIRKRFQLATYRVTVRVYGVQTTGTGQVPEYESARDASIGSGHVSDALHKRTPSISGSGVALYGATEEIGGVPGRDPDTGWEYETSTYIVQVATQVVTP